VNRRLAAILSADVEGYSRLMGDDEAATVRTLTAHRRVLAAGVEAHRGRVVDLTGDSALAEFASVVDAVQAAVEIQRQLALENAELPPQRRMRFRIGINLGDVLVDGDLIYGDGVNVAARIQQLAEGGGVSLSGTAYDQVEGKLPFHCESLGEHAVKNITRPVRVYRVRLDEPASRTGAPPRARPRSRRAVWLAAALIVLGAVAGTVGWRLVARTSAPRTAVPEKPSIAVLPFANLASDATPAMLEDGITEDIITTLSRIASLAVIARASVFTYKDRPVKVQEVGRELGVRYVLEGSVQAAGDRVRITAQLIDASTGHHLWAERFDRPLRDVFALQDEITQKIVTALEVKLTEGEQARIWRRSTTNLEAWGHTMQAVEQLRRFTRDGNIAARELAQRALAADPKTVAGWVILGWTYLTDARLGWTASPGESLERAEGCARRALALDDSAADTYALVATIHLARREHDLAVASSRRAVELSPSGAEVTAILADILNYDGKPDEALALVQRAMRLSPYYPSWYDAVLGHAHSLAGRHEEALAAYRRDAARRPDGLLGHLGLTINLVWIGREDEARASLQQVLRLEPSYSLDRWARSMPYRDREPLERGLDALRRAGLR
jgi:adenylate cyclase